MNGNNRITENNKISDIIKTSLENIRDVVDANTIVGNPITTPQGVTILPISEVSVGFASGGFDYLGKNASSSEKGGNNFGGGGGSGLSVKPVAFIVISADGKTELIPVASPAVHQSGVAALIDNAPTLIDKIKSLIPKKKKSDGDETDEDEEENAGESENADAPADDADVSADGSANCANTAAAE